MSSDAPEFLKTLVELNTTVLAEAVDYGSISAETRESRAKELEVVVEKILAARKADINERLRRLYVERSGGVDSPEKGGPSQEVGCRETLESGCGEAPAEVDVSLLG